MPDIDWGQVIFLILFVIVGFVRWLGNLIEQRKEAQERATLSPEEVARREAAWRKQMGQDTEPAPTSTQPPPDPFRQLRDLFEQLNEPEPKPQRPSSPPPLVQRPAPPPLRAQPPPIPAPPAPAPVLAKAFPTSSFVDRSFTEAVAHRDRRTAPKLMNLRLDLRSPTALRRAVVIREILGPPKALQ